MCFEVARHKQKQVLRDRGVERVDHVKQEQSVKRSSVLNEVDYGRPSRCDDDSCTHRVKTAMREFLLRVMVIASIFWTSLHAFGGMLLALVHAAVGHRGCAITDGNGRLLFVDFSKPCKAVAVPVLSIVGGPNPGPDVGSLAIGIKTNRQEYWACEHRRSRLGKSLLVSTEDSWLGNHIFDFRASRTAFPLFAYKLL